MLTLNQKKSLGFILFFVIPCFFIFRTHIVQQMDYLFMMESAHALTHTATHTHTTAFAGCKVLNCHRYEVSAELKLVVAWMTYETFTERAAVYTSVYIPKWRWKYKLDKVSAIELN